MLMKRSPIVLVSLPALSKGLALHDRFPRLRWGLWSLVLFLFLCGCATSPPARRYETPTALRSELAGDVRTLNAVRAHLGKWENEMVSSSNSTRPTWC